MNKKLRFSMLSVLMMLCGSMFADDVTIVAETSLTGLADNTAITVEGFTFKALKNSGGSTPTYNSGGKDARLYAKNTLTIQGGTMTKIVFNISAQGKKRLAPITASTGTIATQAAGDETVTWTGNASEVTFTVGEKANYGSDGDTKAGQLDFLSVVITGEGGSGGGGGGGQDDNKFTGQTVENIAAFNALDADTEARLTLKNAVVLYVNEYNNTKEIFVRDGSGAALDIYEMGINATAGQVLNGSLVGKRSARSGFIYAMVKGGTYSDGFDVTVTNGNEPEALDLGIDEVAGYYCDYVVVKNAEITSDKKKAVVGGDELPLYDRFKLSLVNDLKADGTKYDFYGLMYDGGATYGAELVVTKVTLAGGGDIVDDPATPVANVEALLGLESPSTNLELTLTDAQVLIVDNNYIYVRENGKAICFYQVNAVKEVVKKNSILNGKINVDYEVYKLLPEVKTNKNTTADNLTVTDGDDAVPTETTLANVAAGNNVCDLVTLKATLVKEVKTNDGGNTSTTYYLQDGDTKIVVVNNGMGLDKIEEGTEVTVVGIANTSNNAHQIKLFKKVEDTTGISNLNVENVGNGQLFNLAGQRVSGSYKGIVIANGKKFVVK